MNNIKKVFAKALLASLFAIGPMGMGSLFAENQPVESSDHIEEDTSPYYETSHPSYFGGGQRYHRGYYRGPERYYYYRYSPYSFLHPYRPPHHRPFHYSYRPYWYYYNW